MKREIKFRGKRLDNGEWVVGDLVENQGRFFIYLATSETTIEDNDDGRITIVAIEVDPATVGQFTGLKDEKGAEIYDGDIIHMPADLYNEDTLTGIVVYDDGKYFVQNEESGQYLSLWSALFHRKGIRIGNMHDNPELLKQE